MSARLYKWLSPLLSLALIMQLLVPVVAQPPAVAASPAEEEPVAVTAVEPAATQPLSLARVQSPVQNDGTMVITYTVSNLQPMAYRPQLPETATVTETIASLAAFDLSRDPNTIRNVVLQSEPAAAAFGHSSPPASNDGNSYLWNLGDLPPQQSLQVVLTVTPPPAGVDFVDLDGGASVYGDYRGRLLTAVAPPARLAPAGYEQWLIWTPDADIYNEQMLRQAASLGQDPATLFAYVRDFDYEAYDGSLRGTLGTLWSEAGNSIDQASLLIAMLRAGGVPARYRHGTLSNSQAGQLILEMFPDPTRYLGQVGPGAEASDPANDPELLTQASDHWWVEAYLPGQGWTDLDPSFAGATLGQQFATPLNDGSDQIAELPAAVRHRLYAAVQVEQYSEFPLAGEQLAITEPLTATYNVVELVGKPLNLLFGVNSEVQGGLAFANVYHTYTPYFRLGTGDQSLAGESFQDFLTNFPLSSFFTTGVWMQVEQIAPDGSRTAYERTVLDLIGPDARLNGGAITLPARDNSPSIQPGTLAQLQVTPQSHVPESELERVLADLALLAPAMAAAQEAGTNLDGADLPAVTDFLAQYGETIDRSQLLMFEHLGTRFNVTTTSPERTSNADNLLVKSYPDQAKLLLMTSALISDTLHGTFELLNIREMTVAYPGQNVDAETVANMSRTIGEKEIEFAVMQALPSDDRDSGLETVMVAHEQGIPLAYINPTNLADLDQLTIPAGARARISAAVQEGMRVVVPEQMVPIRGKDRIGWMELDQTGHASFVNEAGLRANAFENAITTMELLVPTGNMAAFVRSFAVTIFTYLGTILDPAGLQGPGKGFAAVSAAEALMMAGFAGAKACTTTPPFYQPGCWDGFGVAMAIIGIHALSGIDPTLAPQWYSLEPPVAGNPVATGNVDVPASLDNGPFSANLETDHAFLSGPLQAAWSDTITHGLTVELLTATDATLSQSGNLLGDGYLELSGSALAAQGRPLSVAVDGEGSVGFYPPATGGLATASSWDSYSATLTGTLPFTATGFGEAMLNAAPYSGTLRATIAEMATANGSGSSPLPDFAPAASVALDNGSVLLGPSGAGSATAGSDALVTDNGLAVGNFSGAVAVSESNGSRDSLSFGGNADLFTFALDSSSSIMGPSQTLLLNPVIEANYADSYTITVQAPQGWDVQVLAGGQVEATLTTSVEAGTYRIWVSAQSATYPELILSTDHLVTITAGDGMALRLEPDPLTTIPMGTVQATGTLPGFLGHRPDGRAEVPGAAHMIWLTNTSTVSHTFDIGVSGLPAGWTLLSNEGQATATTLALPAGEVGQIGLYISPTLTSLLPQGTNYSVDVTATAQDNPALTQTDSFVFTMPGVAFPYPQLSPGYQYVAVDDTVSFSLTVENVGNIGGQFPLTATVHASAYRQGTVSPTLLTTPATFDTPLLAAGTAHTETIDVSTAGRTPGEVLYLRATATVGDFRPQAVASLLVVNAGTADAFGGSQTLAACSAAATLAEKVEALGQAMYELDGSCAGGQCNQNQLASVIAAAELVSMEAAAAGAGASTAALAAQIAALAAADGDSAIEAALVDLGAEALALSEDICRRSRFRPVLSWTPGYSASLPGQTISYMLQLENGGTDSATYRVEVTLPGSSDTFTETLASGNVVEVVYPLDPSSMGLYSLQATAIATGTEVSVPDLASSAAASLNVVEELLSVTRVTPEPAFVESGTSSTTVTAEIANPANLIQETTARLTVQAPAGAVSHTADLPLTVQSGQPRTYTVGTVDTSGWAEGTYTVTVALWTPGLGSKLAEGYGYLLVGEGLSASQGVTPLLVAPGDITATTTITTQITQDSILPGTLGVIQAMDSVPGNEALGMRSLPERPFTVIEETDGTITFQMEPENATAPVTEESGALPTERYTDDNFERQAHDNVETPFSPAAPAVTGFARYENDDPALNYSGSWNANLNSTSASGGTYHRSDSAGAVMTMTFSGTRVGVGFIAGTGSGEAEIFVDGNSQGVVDLYRTLEDTAAFYYDVVAGTHTLSVTVKGTANPLATFARVNIDYVDVWNGPPLPDGTFEESDARLLYAGNWNNVNDDNASGGTFVNSTNGSVWFPFSGDSVTFQAAGYWLGGPSRIYLDGRQVAVPDLYNPAVITRTYSFTGLGSGGHMLQVSQYRDRVTADTFTTPAFTAPYSETLPAGFIRYEEDHPALLYNGLPLTATATTWDTPALSYASEGYVARSQNAGDTVSLTFAGSWINLGLAGGDWSGKAEITIDGASRGIVDTYRHTDGVFSLVYDDLVPGTHTITVTVLGSRNPFSADERVHLDYVEIWDGSPAVDGSFAAELVDNGRVQSSNDWGEYNATAADDGRYLRSNNGTVWFPFTGDSVTYQAVAASNFGQGRVYLDGQFITVLDLWSATTTTRTFSLGDLGSGPHVLQVTGYRGLVTADTLTTPAFTTPYSETVQTGIIRYEEDDPALLYNGVPYTATAGSWTMAARTQASGGYAAYSATAGDAISLTFTGSWINVGFWASDWGGLAEVYVDGNLQEVVDTYRRYDDSFSRVYDDLGPGSHTLQIEILGTNNGRSTNSRVWLDYVDVWDGTLLPNGTFEARLETAGDRYYYGGGWREYADAAASEGNYLRASDSTAWFHFTGDSVTLEPLARNNAHWLEVQIDGIYQTRHSLIAHSSTTRPLSFQGLGPGPHVVQMRGYRNLGTLDTVTTPGSAPFFTPPVPSGVYRYEENDPALLYNGYPFTYTHNSWAGFGQSVASRGWIARSNTAGDNVSLTFDGSWVAIGLATGSNRGLAEIFIDGETQGQVDTYAPGNDVLEIVYDGLVTGTHTISVTVLGQQNASATNSYIYVDYFDAWDGAAVPAGWYDADATYQQNAQVDMSGDGSYNTDTTAYDGDYYQDPTNVWLRFTGDRVTFQGMSWNNLAAGAEVYIDGALTDTPSLTYNFSVSPLPFHYDNLGPGAHVLRIHNPDRTRVDAFEANPAGFSPGIPMVEWWDGAPAGGAGVISTIAAGDVNRDGMVELAVSSNNGTVSLYRGDGADAGGGSPRIWQKNTGNEPDAPALAQLDGLGDIEIVVGSPTGTVAYRADGSLYWSQPAVTTDFPSGGNAIGNLDADDAPEIVVAASSNGGELVVLEADGTVAWSDTRIAGDASPPVLADLTGDGHLDILVVNDSSNEALLFDYNQGTTPTLAWSYAFSETIGDLRGSPAVADVDGLQPGGDLGPEIVVATSGWMNVLDADGSLLWRAPMGAGAPGGISVADTDGDGEVELITTVQFDGGTVYTFNADGTLLWTAPALDNTSGTSASVHDLDGDGLWEVIWNGSTQGLTVYRGTDGAIIFNEPSINSITRRDYPIVADVDGDGHGEIVAGDHQGVYVVGYDSVWADARPLWNQYNYHVTNVNDDLTIPPQEPDSWLVHNTYRTQTPLVSPAPNYRVVLTHTAGVSGTQVLSDSFSLPVTAGDPLYRWGYDQAYYQPLRSSSFQTVLSSMQPGETRALSQGTELVYALPGGQNRLALPPLYLTAAHIVAITPYSQTVASGSTAVYTITLTNPGTVEAIYSLGVSGLPQSWHALPMTATVPASGSTDLALSVQVPPGQAPGSADFAITVASENGGHDVAPASLAWVPGARLSLEPGFASVLSGERVTFTAVLTNDEAVARTYQLLAEGELAPVLPPAVAVPAGQSISLPVPATALPGLHPLLLEALAEEGPATAQAGAALAGFGTQGVGLALAPPAGTGGPGSQVPFTLTVSNLGDVSDSYGLALALPDGWDHNLSRNGQEVSQVTVPAAIANTAGLLLTITPPLTATPGTVPFTVTATSLSYVAATGQTTGTVTVSERGIQVSITPAQTTLAPSAIGSWQVTITNTGSVADSYDLTPAGIVAATATLPASVSLNPGQAQTVVLEAGPIAYGLPQSYPLSVVARSQGDSQIANQGNATLTLSATEAVGVRWRPETQTVTDTLTAAYTLVISNSGNVGTYYDLALAANEVSGTLAGEQVYVPARASVLVPATVYAPGEGTFPFSGEATSTTSAATDTAGASLTVDAYCPLAGPVPVDTGILLESGALTLTWSPVPQNASGYAVYSHAVPYFDPDADGGLLDSLAPGSESYLVGTNEDGLPPAYYLIRSLTCDGTQTADSQQVGIFGFPLQPGQ